MPLCVQGDLSKRGRAARLQRSLRAYSGRDGYLYSPGLFRALALRKTAFPLMFGGSFMQYLVTVGGKPAAVVAFSPLADYLYNYLEAAFPEESVSLWAGGCLQRRRPGCKLSDED